jgi:ubiquinone/menaquinone biosynthesis C-methylase UbiE
VSGESKDPTERFSGRVGPYARCRPSYPPAIVETTLEAGRLHAGETVADVGSGTGKLSRLFLDVGCRVLAVEPNRDMREQAEANLAGVEGFVSIAGRAERTTIPDHSVHLIAAGQAFHWFDRDAAREEFVRILRPDGWVMLVWNIRRTSATPFMEAYDAFLQEHALGGERVGHHRPEDTEIRKFIANEPMEIVSVHHHQVFDREGLEGRVVSSSYIPDVTHPGHGPMIDALERLFASHQQDGRVRFEYETRAYYGRLGL